MEQIVLYEYEVQDSKRRELSKVWQEFLYAQCNGFNGEIHNYADAMFGINPYAFLLFCAKEKLDNEYEIIILPDEEINIIPLDAEIKYLEDTVDDEACDFNYDSLYDEVAWYSYARQMGWE